MLLHPRFYEAAPIDRIAERKKLGLDPDLPTGIVLFGGYGTWKMLDIVRQINRSSLQVQLILVCGRNEKLADAVRKESSRIPLHVEGFTLRIPYFMALADFFIGKPGPGSISEALAKRLPVIVQRNAWTMVHERYNADWVEEMGVGLGGGAFAKELAGAVRTMLAAENYERFRTRAAGMRNSAVYEIPDLLEQ